MTADPTAEHTRALRQAISDPGATTPRGDDYREHIVDWQLRALMAQPEALAASLPAEVMLDALVRAGVLTEFRIDARLNEDGSLTTDAYIEHCNVKARQFVTPWEVAP